jgi:TatD DNase family protein
MEKGVNTANNRSLKPGNITYIDIHTHSFYQDPETTLVLNAFPEEEEKLDRDVYCSIGLHPWHVKMETWEKKAGRIRNLAANNNIIAIGEAGLDKMVENDYEVQRKAFISQLELAESVHKPLIVHCVRSYSEMLSYRKKSDQSLPWIFHWFNSDIRMAEELIRKNCYLSFGHMLFNSQSKAFRTFAQVSPDHIFFETDDAGYTIKEIYARAAELRNISLSGLQSQIIDNFARCFQL